MSIPTSRIAATAAGLTSTSGSEPPDHAMARPLARWLNQPSAICDRPALWTHKNSTSTIKTGDSDQFVNLVVSPTSGRQTSADH